jgi:lipopolysaccharide/colanic/teichoic acid biosynthesis glycosyltransferase
VKQVEINETVKVSHIQPQTNYQFLTMIGRPVTGWKLVVKRVFDLIVGLVGTVLSSPIVLIFAILVKLTSKGPAFYKQERVGLMGKSFNVIKLRSMYQDAEARTGAVWA